MNPVDSSREGPLATVSKLQERMLQQKKVLESQLEKGEVTAQDFADKVNELLNSVLRQASEVLTPEEFKNVFGFEYSGQRAILIDPKIAAASEMVALASQTTRADSSRIGRLPWAAKDIHFRFGAWQEKCVADDPGNHRQRLSFISISITKQNLISQTCIETVLFKRCGNPLATELESAFLHKKG
jgi:hypothetical protein